MSNNDVRCRALPHLVLLRGTGWEPKHWHQIFSLLGLKGKAKDKVTLKDILAKADNIANSLDAIKQLNAQAQSEAVIRKALDELDLWGCERKFQLSDGVDSKGTKVCLDAALPMMQRLSRQLDEQLQAQCLLSLIVCAKHLQDAAADQHVLRLQ
jgi:Dynein heavy chain, N-terminal region 2